MNGTFVQMNLTEYKRNYGYDPQHQILDPLVNQLAIASRFYKEDGGLYDLAEIVWVDPIMDMYAFLYKTINTSVPDRVWHLHIFEQADPRDIVKWRINNE